MPLARFFVALLLALPALAAAQTEPARKEPAAAKEERPAPKPPLATSRRQFFIPVSVDRTSGDHVPAEVHLLVSADQGKTWSTYARQGIDSKGFEFKARDDGEYWFASRTLDAQGHPKPSGPTEAELKIVIDTTQPKIEIDAALTGEQIKAAWRISDATLSVESVRIDYQSPDNLKAPWQSVTLDPAQQQASGGMVLGSATWSPQSSSRVIDVRIIAQDRAGNVATDVKRVFLPRRPDPMISKLPEFPTKPTPKVAGSGPSNSGDPFTSRQFGAGGTFSRETAAKTPGANASGSLNSGSPSPGAQAWPADNKLPTKTPVTDAQGSPARIPTEPLARVPSEVAPPVSDRVVARPSSTSAGNAPIWSGDEASSSAEAAPLESVPRDVPPASRSFPKTFNEPLADGLRPQLTASKTFSLDYDLESVGPAGVRAVELWVTTDNGQTWDKWGEDEDRRSPFEIQVQSERLFGFRMVIVANNGLATRSPQPGDAADIWVAVDSVKPQARLLQAAYGMGEHSGQLDIRWEADDEHLGQRPVTLAFSEAPDGPWTTLAAGLPNSGQHFWTVDPRTPRQLYLRLEVRDDAGNVGLDQTAEPISLEGLSPKGRIRAVMPGPPPTQGAFRSPLFR